MDSKGLLRGRVVARNGANNFIAIEIDGEFTVAELLCSYDPAIGVDWLVGDLHTVGRQDLAVVGTQEPVHVFVQDCQCSAARVRELFE